MNRLFQNRKLERWFGLIFSLGLILLTVYLSNVVVEGLKRDEIQKIKDFAKAQELLTNHFWELSNPTREFLLEFLQSNNTVPVLLVDENGEYMDSRNVPMRFIRDSSLLQYKIMEMRRFRDPIKLEGPDQTQYIYFENSELLKRLQLYPMLVVIVLILFVLFALWYYNSMKNTEQTLLWAGLAKETAHQIGTPLSSLMGWLELLRTENIDPTITDELEKDINRLRIITDRFSKIGSKEELQIQNIVELTRNSLEYLQNRLSKKVNFHFNSSSDLILINLNPSLYSWVIENLIKNGVDAMSNEGDIFVNVVENSKTVEISVRDTGTGIPAAKHLEIFKPGYTTKKRGWGLGLSLAKRIIEDYHRGSIFVAFSEINKGTTIKIVLQKPKDLLTS